MGCGTGREKRENAYEQDKCQATGTLAESMLAQSLDPATMPVGDAESHGDAGVTLQRGPAIHSDNGVTPAQPEQHQGLAAQPSVSSTGLTWGSRTPDTKRGSEITIGTMGNMVLGRTATTFTLPPVPIDDPDDPDETITRNILKLRETALVETQLNGASKVRVHGVLALIPGPVEMTAKEMARFRRWVDLLPPFDPIPVLEQHGDVGRPPKEATLRINQELLEAHERETNRAQQQSDRPKPLDGKVRSACWSQGRTGVLSPGAGSPTASGVMSPTALVPVSPFSSGAAAPALPPVLGPVSQG
eukprot:TRINITY_DN56154_c0_g1_i1.p1 TRINITY_DN56154_c0_g1~~TRINITY_DN56154_c0_g1_i1.p1  ORF type:complete len:302 (+),score=22.75 TRINITY_DN56154_c0_g1_i1:153-1058(+)